MWSNGPSCYLKNFLNKKKVSINDWVRGRDERERVCVCVWEREREREREREGGRERERVEERIAHSQTELRKVNTVTSTATHPSSCSVVEMPQVFRWPGMTAEESWWWRCFCWGCNRPCIWKQPPLRHKPVAWREQHYHARALSTFSLKKNQAALCEFVKNRFC